MHRHTPTNNPASHCVQNVAVEPPVHQAGEASMTSLPASPYLLIKEPLNSQKLQRVQERSMHSNTISKHHIFFTFLNSAPDPWYFHTQTQSCIYCAYKFGEYKHKHANASAIIKYVVHRHTFAKEDELRFRL